MSMTSTVPGAITTLQGYMTTVAAATSVPNVSTYLGKSATDSQLAFNFFMVGDFHNGIPVAPDGYTWEAIPGQAKYVRETYALQGCIACWEGAWDPLARLTDAYTLLNALHTQIRNDIGGSGSLTPSGSWGELLVTMDEFGPINQGWGVALGFQLHVQNAVLTG